MEGGDLKALALGRYGTCTRFAREMGWHRLKGHRLLSGRQEPSLHDIKRMAERMELSDEAVVALFFGTMFTE